MSLYLKESRSLFHHIPNTGGHWIEKACCATGIKAHRRNVVVCQRRLKTYTKLHPLLGFYNGEILSKIDFIFTFVRHPVNFYESVWRRIKMASNNAERYYTWWSWHPYREVVKWCQQDFTFDDWLYWVLKEQPLWYTRLIESYIGPEGGEFCWFIGRTRTLIEDFFLVMNYLGYGDRLREHRKDVLSLGRINPTRAPKIEWNPDLQKQVELSEKLVIQRFFSEETIGRRWYVPKKTVSELAEEMASKRKGRIIPLS